MFCCMFAGTASVALAGLLAAQRATGKPITEHRVLFLGAGEVRWDSTAVRDSLTRRLGSACSLNTPDEIASTVLGLR